MPDWSELVSKRVSRISEMGGRSEYRACKHIEVNLGNLSSRAYWGDGCLLGDNGESCVPGNSQGATCSGSQEGKQVCFVDGLTS